MNIALYNGEVKYTAEIDKREYGSDAIHSVQDIVLDDLRKKDTNNIWFYFLSNKKIVIQVFT